MSRRRAPTIPNRTTTSQRVGIGIAGIIAVAAVVALIVFMLGSDSSPTAIPPVDTIDHSMFAGKLDG